MLPSRAMKRILVALTLSLATPALAGSADKEASAHYDKGKHAFDDGDFTKAIDELKASVAAKPNAKAYLLLGTAYTKVGQLDDAKKAFEEMLKADPNSSKKKTVENLIRELDVLAKTKLTVTSTPPGATVFLDLKADGPRGKTPLELPATPGQHRVMVDLEGYEGAVQTVTAVEGSSVPVAVTLQVKGCDLAVDSNPTGVGFTVDEKNPAKTPATVRVATGKHFVKFSGAGIEEQTETVACEGTRPLRLAASLKVSRKAVVALKAPGGAQVAVDGKPVPAEEAKLMAVDPGEHLIDVTREGMAPWHVSVVLKPGEKLDLQPRLDVGGGVTGVEVFTQPASAVVRVDGKRAPSGAPVPLAPGHHTLEVRATGHDPLERHLTIVPGEHTRVEAQLRPRGRALLFVGLGATALAIATETLALVGRSRAADQLAGSQSWQDWHNLELGGQIATGTLGAIAVASFIGYVVLWRTGGDSEPRTRVSAAPTPTGGSLVLTRSF